MFWLFSFRGHLRPLPYAASSLGVFASQHAAVALAFGILGKPLQLDWIFYVVPLRTVVNLDRAADLASVLALTYLVLASWALAALAFRRAADADFSEWIAAAAIAPLVQIPVILFLCLLPSRAGEDRPARSAGAGAPTSGWSAAVQGVIAGMGLTVFAVALGALGFGAYGYGLFVVSPFIIGATTAYFANRPADIGAGQTARLVAGATLLGGIALVVTALEGVVCIVLASPLGLGVALVGGLFGRSVALRGRSSAKQTLSGIALLPIVFASENLLAIQASFDMEQTIEVAAPPGIVWQSLIRMDPIEAPTGLPFRLGVAYPIRGEIVGEGVGALRYGEFSTGTAVERITEWVPDRLLSFVVVKDVPAMRELSPYRHVHAPHVAGYFLTTSTSFELLPLAGGRTRIVHRTAHELKLDPALYWLPMARWLVQENNRRVLAHIRHQAERSLGGRPTNPLFPPGPAGRVGVGSG